jgi:hypothetical protein
MSEIYFTISDGNGSYLGSSKYQPSSIPIIVTLKDPTDPYAQWTGNRLINRGSGYYLSGILSDIMNLSLTELFSGILWTVYDRKSETKIYLDSANPYTIAAEISYSRNTLKYWLGFIDGKFKLWSDDDVPLPIQKFVIAPVPTPNPAITSTTQIPAITSTTQIPAITSTTQIPAITTTTQLPITTPSQLPNITTTSNPITTPSQSSGLSQLAIIGICIGSISTICIIIAIIYFTPNTNTNTIINTGISTKVGMSTFSKIAIFLLLYLVLVCVTTYVKIKSEYKQIFRWWTTNGGKNYDKFFNVFSVMASHYSVILYYISQLSGTLENQINRPQIQFLINSVFPFLTGFTTYDPRHFVLPCHLCRDIKFKISDGDRLFNDWVHKNNLVETESVIFDINNEIVTRSNHGIYPLISSGNQWRLLFTYWGSTWIMEDNTSIWIPKASDDGWTEWLDIQKHPDNFLARYGITPDSPGIIGFINNSYNDPKTGVIFRAQSFKTLLGGVSEGIPGGWVGYVTSFDTTAGLDTMSNYLYTVYETENKPPLPTPEDTTCSSADTTSNILGGIESGIGIAGLGVFFLAMGPIGLVAGAITIVAGIGIGTASGINEQNKCDNKQMFYQQKMYKSRKIRKNTYSRRF